MNYFMPIWYVFSWNMRVDQGLLIIVSPEFCRTQHSWMQGTNFLTPTWGVEMLIKTQWVTWHSHSQWVPSSDMFTPTIRHELCTLQYQHLILSHTQEMMLFQLGLEKSALILYKTRSTTVAAVITTHIEWIWLS